jgi:uncharacterized protein (DUF2267 family)
MQYAEFAEKVQTRTRLETGDMALDAVQATLETLGERLERDERRRLAAELPSEMERFLFKREETTRFLLEDFYKRVAARADIRVPEAIERSQTVVSVLQESVSAGLLDEIRAQLPEEYDELFAGEPYGPASPSA